MADRLVSTPAASDSPGDDPAANPGEMMRLFRAEVQREIDAHLAAGRPIYYGGIGDESGKLFMRMPDGRRFEYRVREDGSREIVRELTR